MLGELVGQFTLGRECKEQGVLDVKIWGTGLVALTGELQLVAVTGIDDRPSQPRQLADPQLEAPPTSWTIVEPRHTLSKGVEVFTYPSFSSFYYFCYFFFRVRNEGRKATLLDMVGVLGDHLRDNFGSRRRGRERSAFVLRPLREHGGFPFGPNARVHHAQWRSARVFDGFFQGFVPVCDPDYTCPHDGLVLPLSSLSFVLFPTPLSFKDLYQFVTQTTRPHDGLLFLSLLPLSYHSPPLLLFFPFLHIFNIIMKI